MVGCGRFRSVSTCPGPRRPRLLYPGTPESGPVLKHTSLNTTTKNQETTKNREAAMTVKLGTNPIAWSNDDLPELGGDTLLETCLRETREAGFTGTEMGNKFPKQPDALKAKLAEYRLEFVSGWYSAELRTRTVEEEIRAMQPHLDLLAACGCKVMVFAETSGTVQGRRDVPVSDRPIMSEDEWPVYLDRIAKLSEYMASKGVNLAFHHHMGTVIEKASEVDRLLSGTPDTVG